MSAGRQAIGRSEDRPSEQQLNLIEQQQIASTVMQSTAGAPSPPLPPLPPLPPPPLPLLHFVVVVGLYFMRARVTGLRSISLMIAAAVSK